MKTKRLTVLLGIALACGCQSPRPPVAVSSAEVNINTGAAIGPARFNFRTNTCLDAPPQARTDSSVGADTIDVLAAFEEVRGANLEAYCLGILGVKFKVVDPTGRVGTNVLTNVKFEFVFDYDASCEVRGDSRTTAIARYDVTCGVRDPTGFPIPFPAIDPGTRTNVIGDLPLVAQINAPSPGGPGQRQIISRAEAGLVCSTMSLLRVGETYVAAIQASARATLNGAGSSTADGQDGTRGLRLKRIVITP
jgi:hypothetical protein